MKSIRDSINILGIIALCVFSLQAFSGNKADVDLWGNVGFVSAGPWSKAFNYENTYSFTEPASPWINHEWLGQYVFHSTYEFLASTGLILLKVLLGFLLLFIIYLPIRNSFKSKYSIFFLALLIISTLGYGFSTRPHLLTYILYAVFLLILRNYSQNGDIRKLFILPVLGIFWANIHGAFFIGLLLLLFFLILTVARGLYAGINQEVRKDLTRVGIVSLLFFAGTLINPYGGDLWQFIFESSVVWRPFLSEWDSFTSWKYILEHMDFVFLSLASLFFITRSKKPKDLRWIGILVVSFLAAIIMRRNIPLFAITAGFVVPVYIDDIVEERLIRFFNKISKWVLAVILLILVAASLGSTSIFYNSFLEIQVPRDRFPVGAVKFIKANKIQGNALVFFDWAEYFIWKFYPECKVFLDGRLRSAYGVKTINDFLNFIYFQDGWERAISDYPTDMVLIHNGNPVYMAMERNPGWVRVYRDNISSLFLKREKHEDVLTKYGRNSLVYPVGDGGEFFP